eukprot:scaffold1.g5859.t1
MAAQVAAPAHDSSLGSEEPAPDDAVSLELGTLDITTEQLSLAGIEKEIEAFAESEELRAILDQGVDPRTFARQYDAQLRSAEMESIQDYIAESENLIKECDGILGEMEGTLGRFQADLGSISSEIRSLQEQSQRMSVQLRNRKQLQARWARERLDAFIDSTAIPPSLVYGIVQGDVNAEFLEHLAELGRKLDFVAGDETARLSAAYRDIAPELERLKARAVGKARDFLMERIYEMRRPKTSMQAKQAVLLRYKGLATFLHQHGRDIYAEVRGAYVEKVSGKLLDLFRAYWATLDRLELTVATAADLIAAPEAAGAASLLGYLGSAVGGVAGGGGGVASRAEVFALRDRAAVLAQLEAPPLVLHQAEAEGKRFPFEVGAEGPLDTNIERLRYAAMNLLLAMSRQLQACAAAGQAAALRTKGTVFLILNFSFVVAVLREAHAQGLPATPGSLSTGEGATGLGATGLALLKEFEEGLARSTALYVDEQLGRAAPALVNFVKRGEAAANGVAEGQPVPGYGPAQAAPLAAEFGQRWQAAAQGIAREVGRDFGSSPAGRALLLHYNRFLELCKRQGAEGLAVTRGAVTIPALMHGLKQFSGGR